MLSILELINTKKYTELQNAMSESMGQARVTVITQPEPIQERAVSDHMIYQIYLRKISPLYFAVLAEDTVAIAILLDGLSDALRTKALAATELTGHYLCEDGCHDNYFTTWDSSVQRAIFNNKPQVLTALFGSLSARYRIASLGDVRWISDALVTETALDLRRQVFSHLDQGDGVYFLARTLVSAANGRNYAAVKELVNRFDARVVEPEIAGLSSVGLFEAIINIYPERKNRKAYEKFMPAYETMDGKIDAVIALYSDYIRPKNRFAWHPFRKHQEAAQSCINALLSLKNTEEVTVQALERCILDNIPTRSLSDFFAYNNEDSSFMRRSMYAIQSLIRGQVSINSKVREVELTALSPSVM